jgi:hypothetical protein
MIIDPTRWLGYSILRRTAPDYREGGPFTRDFSERTRGSQRPIRRQEDRKERATNETRCKLFRPSPSAALLTLPPLARPQTIPQRARKTRTRPETRRGQTSIFAADDRETAEGVRRDGVGEEG